MSEPLPFSSTSTITSSPPISTSKPLNPSAPAFLPAFPSYTPDTDISAQLLQILSLHSFRGLPVCDIPAIFAREFGTTLDLSRMSHADLSVLLDSTGVLVVAQCPQSFSEAMVDAGFKVDTGVVYSNFDLPLVADDSKDQEKVVETEVVRPVDGGTSLVTPLGRHAALYAVHPNFASFTKDLREFRQRLIRVVVEFTKRNVTQQQRPEQQQGLALSLFAAEWARCFANVEKVGSLKDEREELGVMKLMPLLQAVPELAVTGVHPEVRVRLKVLSTVRSSPVTDSETGVKSSKASSAAALLAQRLGPAVGGLLAQALATADPQQRATVMRLLESIKTKAMTAVASAADPPGVTAATVFAVAAAKVAAEKAHGKVADVPTSLTRNDVLVLLRKALTHWRQSIHPAPQGGNVLGTVDGFREIWRRCYPSLRPAESYLGGDDGLKAALDELGEVAVLPGARIVLVAQAQPCTPPLAGGATLVRVPNGLQAVGAPGNPVGPSEIRRRVQEIVAVAGADGVTVGTLKGVYRTRYKREAEEEAREAGFSCLDDVFRGLAVTNGRVFLQARQNENMSVGLPRVYAKNQLLAVRRSALKQ